jgi:hypothetical protein
MSAFDPAIFHVKRIFLNKREDNVPFEGAFEKKKQRSANAQQAMGCN